MEQKDFVESVHVETGSKSLNLYINSYITLLPLIFVIGVKVLGRFFGRSSKVKGSKESNVLGLESLPGPWSLDPTGLIGVSLCLLPFEKTFSTSQKWFQKHGDILLANALNKRWVGINSGPLVQTLLKSTDMGHQVKAPIPYDILKPFVTNGLLVSKGRFWQQQRKILQKSQSYQSLKGFMPRLNKHCRYFVIKLEEMFKDGEHHQINGLINSSFIKVISEMITGFDNDQSDEYTRYHHNFQIWKETTTYRIFHPWLIPEPLWKLHPASSKAKVAIHEMFEFARRRYQEHKQGRTNSKMQNGEDANVMDGAPNTKWRSALDELIDAGVAEEQIIDEINTMMFGGHETGAGTIHFFFFCMALNPDIQKECQKEVDELFQNAGSYKDGEVGYEVMSSSLKLVERCILETLRLYPPAVAQIRELESPLKLNHKNQDYLIPAGTNVVIFPYALQRKAEYYPDPDKFDPNRFLPEEVAKRHQYCYIPFSAGARNCLGLKFAMIEMKTIVAYTLRHFSLSTTDKEEISLLPFVTITPAKDYTFKFTRRDVIRDF